MNSNELLQLRQARLDAMRQNKTFKKEWEEENAKLHAKNLEIKKGRELIENKVKETMTLKKKRQDEVRIDQTYIRNLYF